MQLNGGTCKAAFVSTWAGVICLIKAVVGGPAGPAMAGLVFGNGIKLTSSIKSINFRIYSFCLLFIKINTNLFLLFIRRLRD